MINHFAAEAAGGSDFQSSCADRRRAGVGIVAGESLRAGAVFRESYRSSGILDDSREGAGAVIDPYQQGYSAGESFINSAGAGKGVHYDSPSVCDIESAIDNDVRQVACPEY